MDFLCVRSWLHRTSAARRMAAIICPHLWNAGEFEGEAEVSLLQFLSSSIPIAQRSQNLDLLCIRSRIHHAGAVRRVAVVLQPDIRNAGESQRVAEVTFFLQFLNSSVLQFPFFTPKSPFGRISAYGPRPLWHEVIRLRTGG